MSAGAAPTESTARCVGGPRVGPRRREQGRRGSPPAEARVAARPREEGFALVPVLLVLALLGLVGTEFAFSMRLEAAMVRAYKEAVFGRHLAEAGAEQAIREILTDHQLAGLPGDDPLTFFRSPGNPLPRLPRESVALGNGRFSYRITDEESRINLNTASEALLQRLLSELGHSKRVRDTIVDSIQDWKDPNEEHRLNGAESDDTYLKLPVPYRSRNGNFEDIAELLQVKGITPEIYHGRDGQAALKDYVTVFGRGQVNINTASELALRALALSAAEVSEIVQTRRAVPYSTVPPTVTGRGLATTSRTFRIEAEGRLGSEAPTRLIAIVAKQPGVVASSSALTVLAWRPERGGPATRSAP
jgi:type II secretory pathway component PulK